MQDTVYMGIIGNYKGHLGAAENIQESTNPNGMFIITNEEDKTLTSGTEVNYPDHGTDVDVEPEFVIRFEAQYENEQLIHLKPKEITVGNDLTIRSLHGSTKIAQRKSWGENSKGIGNQWWDIDNFDQNFAKGLSLVSFVERGAEYHCATPLVDCSATKLFGDELINWMVDCINQQQGHGIYDELLPQLKEMNFPSEFIVFIGAPNYSEWGTENFIERGDKIHIVAFNGTKEINKNTINEELLAEQSSNPRIISLTQAVI